MFINKALSNVAVQCINLRSRREKKLYMKKVMKKNGIPDNFYMAVKHATDPKRGCLESHYEVIKAAVAKGQKRIFILEDDVVFRRKLSTLAAPPEDWDMLYLGGTVKHNLGKVQDGWSRVTAWTTHAYILNLENKELVGAILGNMLDWEGEVDNFYVEVIQPKFNTYMATPMMCVQKDGFSDIEGKSIDYSFMEDTLEGLQKPRHTIENGGYRLHLRKIEDDRLPFVSVVTVTHNRRNFLPLALTNWENIYYPRDKLEWIIVEEECEESWNNIEKIVDNAKYISLPATERYTIAQKRNIGCENARGEVICFMDSDDYYPKESVITRARLLIEYDKTDIVGSSLVGTYDIMTGRSGYVSDGQLALAEASMGFRRSAWQKQKFDETQTVGEYRGFLAGRTHQAMDVPYCFIMVAIQHYSNISNKEIKQQEGLDLTVLFDDESKLVIEKTRQLLLGKIDAQIAQYAN